MHTPRYNKGLPFSHNTGVTPHRKLIGWSVAEIWPFEVLPGRLFRKGSLVDRWSVGRSVWFHILFFATLYPSHTELRLTATTATSNRWRLP